MYSVIVAAILGACLFAFFGHKIYQGGGYLRWLRSVLTGAIIGSFIVGGMGGGLAAWIIGDNAPNECVNPSEFPLANLSDAVTTQGSFFLGSGYINSQLTYFYYMKLADGGYRAYQMPASEAEIKMDENSVHPHVTYYDFQLQGEWKKWGWVGSHAYCTTIFYIPQGSIKQNYSVGG